MSSGEEFRPPLNRPAVRILQLSHEEHPMTTKIINERAVDKNGYPDNHNSEIKRFWLVQDRARTLVRKMRTGKQVYPSNTSPAYLGFDEVLFAHADKKILKYVLGEKTNNWEVDFENAIEQAALSARKRMIHRLQKEAHDLRTNLKAVYDRDPTFLGYIQKEFRLQESETLHLRHVQRAASLHGTIINIDDSSESDKGNDKGRGTLTGTPMDTSMSGTLQEGSSSRRKRQYASKSTGPASKKPRGNTRVSSPARAKTLSPRSPSPGSNKGNRLERSK